jgi:hypothetical protein
MVRHISLIDTPGLQDPESKLKTEQTGSRTSRFARTIGAVASFDMFVFLIDCSAKPTESTYNNLKLIRAQLDGDGIPAITRGILVCSKANFVEVKQGDSNGCTNQTQCWNRRAKSEAEFLRGNQHTVLSPPGIHHSEEELLYHDWVKRILFVDQEMGSLRAQVLGFVEGANQQPNGENTFDYLDTLQLQAQDAGTKIRRSIAPDGKQRSTMPCTVFCTGAEQCNAACATAGSQHPECKGHCVARTEDFLVSELASLSSNLSMHDASKRELLHDILLEASSVLEVQRCISSTGMKIQMLQAATMLHDFTGMLKAASAKLATYNWSSSCEFQQATFQQNFSSIVSNLTHLLEGFGDMRTMQL